MAGRITLSQAEKDLVVELYDGCGLTRDNLPYTPEFERMHATFVARTGREISLHDFWKAVASAGKASRLRRKER